jgi:hypothetical protein
VTRRRSVAVICFLTCLERNLLRSPSTMASGEEFSIKGLRLLDVKNGYNFRFFHLNVLRRAKSLPIERFRKVYRSLF